MKTFSRLLVALLLGSIGWAHGEVIETLYQQSIPVEDQSPASLKRAARTALELVLVRVSGDRGAAADEGVQAALGRADSLVEQYRYQRNPALGSDPDAAPWSVLLSFDDNSVNRLLREAGLPLWPANRPVVLTWLVLDDSNGRRLVDDGGAPEWLEGWRAAAEQRGLILRFPLLDLVDRAALSPDAAWQLRIDQAWQAADRYRADALLLCRAAALSDERWLGSCSFSFGGQQHGMDISTTDPASYADQVVNRLADRLAEQYAIAPISDGAGIVLLQVSGIDRFDDYATVINTVARLAAVNSVAMVGAEDDRLVLALTLGADVDRLRNALALERRLQSEGTVGIAYRGQHTGGLHYRWLEPGAQP